MTGQQVVETKSIGQPPRCRGPARREPVPTRLCVTISRPFGHSRGALCWRGSSSASSRRCDPPRPSLNPACSKTAENSARFAPHASWSPDGRRRGCIRRASRRFCGSAIQAPIPKPRWDVLSSGATYAKYFDRFCRNVAFDEMPAGSHTLNGIGNGSHDHGTEPLGDLSDARPISVEEELSRVRCRVRMMTDTGRRATGKVLRGNDRIHESLRRRLAGAD